jgi:hypothetical protein
LVPAIVMVIMTIASLVYSLYTDYIPNSNIILTLTDTISLVLPLGVVILSIRKASVIYTG